VFFAGLEVFKVAEKFVLVVLVFVVQGQKLLRVLGQML
jgi:hypothetical protein